MKYEPVIGLEVHVELNTKTKMFCGCLADYFGKSPNTSTCPVCLGLPGALPFINQEAINKCIKIGLALNCNINQKSYFERKNYFYPDLAKGFQTSQLVAPLAVSGSIEVEGLDGQVSKIAINRVHQEEDTGKLTHLGNQTLIDFNRSGVPLVEIVSEPDFRNSAQIKDYAKKLQQIFRYLGVSNADMERGDMRLEANVSVRPVGQKELPPYRIELKNINSFRFMTQAVEYEIARQTKAIEAGEKLIQETRGWDEALKKTYLQRSKEEAHDYRYFPEPDLPPLLIEPSQVEEIKSQMPELPMVRVQRFISEFQITRPNALVLVQDSKLADFFEKVVNLAQSEGLEAKLIANVIINTKINPTQAPQEVIAQIKSQKSGIISDEFEIEKEVLEVIAENPKLVTDYKSGKLPIIQALVGLVMRKSGGKAEAGKVRQILERLLS